MGLGVIDREIQEVIEKLPDEKIKAIVDGAVQDYLLYLEESVITLRMSIQAVYGNQCTMPVIMDEALKKTVGHL